MLPTFLLSLTGYMEVTYILSALAGVLALKLLLQSPKGLPPGPRPWPIIGNLPLIIKQKGYVHELFVKLSKIYGPIFCIKLFRMRMVILTDFVLIKEAFSKRGEYFSARPTRKLIVMNKVIGGTGIAFNDGKVWKDTRRFLLHGFREFELGRKSFEFKIHEEIKAFQNEIKAKDGKPFNPQHLLLPAVSNIICLVTFGTRFDYQDERFQDLIKRINYNLTHLSVTHPANFLPGLFYFSKVIRNVNENFEMIYAFIEEQIEQHRKEFDANNIQDIIDYYLKSEAESTGNEQFMTRKNMRGMIRDLFVAGSDTASTTLRWVLLHMIAYPEVQKKCQKQIDEVVGAGRMVSMADYNDLSYVAATLSEICRIASVAAVSLPHFTTEEVHLGGYRIPPNTIVSGAFYAVHHNAEYWENPETFNPDRWLDEEEKLKPNEKFIPFSIGARNCVGEKLAKMELFLMFASMIQRFDFEKEDPNKVLDLDGPSALVRSPKDFNIIALER